MENDGELNRLYELKKEHQLQIGAITSGYNQAEIINKALDVTVSGE